MNVIGMDKLLWCYRFARDYDVKPLEEFCEKQIGANIKTLFQSTDFLSCERVMLCHVLNLDLLNCNETNVFDGCISWARTKFQRDVIDATDTANLRVALGEAFFKIRNEEFAIINRKYSGFLPAQESIEVFHAIALKAQGVQSTTFGDGNSKQRQPIKSNLECSFAKGPRIPFNSTTSDYLGFYTDKAIEWNGFVICNKINDDNIGVKIGIESESGQHCPKKTKRHINSNFQQSSSGLYGFNIESHITQNGVLFQFPKRVCKKTNLITRLLFNIDK